MRHNSLGVVFHTPRRDLTTDINRTLVQDSDSVINDSQLYSIADSMG